MHRHYYYIAFLFISNGTKAVCVCVCLYVSNGTKAVCLCVLIH